MARSVLVVEDDPDFRALVTRLVTSWGHRVVADVGTAADAVACAAEVRPELAVVDIGLPDGDGIELAGRLRALTDPPQVVLISSDAHPGTTDRVERVGACAFFLKEHLTGGVFRRCLDEAGRP